MDGDEPITANGARIDLATTPQKTLGRLRLLPATRQVIRDDGAEEVIEPRMMEVLLVLLRADGGIVTRHDLTESCWEGRVVGEDAINRVISRLRRLSEGIGAGSFRLETVTKIGYRLVRDGETAPSPAAPVPQRIAPRPPTSSRRNLLVGGGALAVVAAGSAGWYVLSRPKPSVAAPPADVAGLLDQARTQMEQDSPDAIASALGMLRTIIQRHPDYADGWALLAQTNATFSHSAKPDEVADYQEKAQDAARRAMELDPGNPTAMLALAILLPQRGHWIEQEQAARNMLARHPDNRTAKILLAAVMAAVGRWKERVRLLNDVAQGRAYTPSLLYPRVIALWAAGRLADADRAMDEAFALQPRHYAIWFTRFYLWLYTGRIPQAIAFAQNVDGRPVTIPTSEIEEVLAVAHAMLTHDPAQVKQVVATWMDKAHKGAGHAENAMQFLSTLGHVDEAFQVAEACYFGRGFQTADVRFTVGQGAYTRIEDRRTFPLFLPSTAAMRSDPRFKKLTGELGLEGYWRQTGTLPDYRS